MTLAEVVAQRARAGVEALLTELLARATISSSTSGPVYAGWDFVPESDSRRVFALNYRSDAAHRDVEKLGGDPTASAATPIVTRALGHC